MEEINSGNKNEELSGAKENKQSFIIFAKLNKYFLIPFISPVFCMLANYFLGKIIRLSIIKKLEFIASIFILLTYIFAGLVYFISYFEQKIDKEKEYNSYNRNSQLTINYIYNKENNRNKKYKVLLLLILMGILLGIFELFGVLSFGKHLFEYRLYFFLFIPLFSKFILKENIYKHHYFSLIIALSGIICLFVPVCVVIKSEDIIPNILHFIGGICLSLFIVLIKFINHKYYISTFILSLFSGIISIIFICFGFVIYSLIRYHDLSYFNNCFDFSKVENKLNTSLYFILCFLFATILQILTLLAVFYFSPILITLTDIISPMLLWILNSILEGCSLLEGFMNFIGYLIVLFAALIYNEIIILNCCGFNNDTKKFVEQRLYKEILQIKRSDDEDSQNKDSSSVNDESFTLNNDSEYS